MFTVVLVNTKVVDNYFILLVLNFHDPRSDSLGVACLIILVLDFDYILCRLEKLACLVMLTWESCEMIKDEM
jgi:hypothetical protein